jgi:uncharacterized SAM-binding protein YcdF (DUF218 family)
MFFALSKTLNLLLLPMTMVVGFFILFVCVKKQPWKKRFFWTGFSLLLLFSNDFISNELMKVWEIDTRPFSEIRPYQVGIVLTGATQSFIQPDDRVYFQRGADRVTHTIQLYKLGLIKKVLISGGTGRLFKDDEPEANKFKKVMLMAGVNEDDIIVENRTRNTYESAVVVSKIVDSLNFKSEDCLLITSAFHMRRSLACYEKAGLSIDSFTVDFYGLPGKPFFPTILVPSIQGFIIWEKLFKEWAGLTARSQDIFSSIN